MRFKDKAKGLLGLLGAGALALGMSGDAKGEGLLNMENVINSSYPRFTAVHVNDPSATDGKDSLDNLWMQPPSGTPGIYSVVPEKLAEDYRFPSSDTPFSIFLVYTGILPSPTENHLEFSFPYAPNYTFEHKTNLTLETPLGSRYNVRAIIDGTLGGELNPSPGVFNLPDLAAGSYNTGTPYASYQVDFQPVNIPEPSSISLLAMAGIAGAGVGAYNYLRSRGRRKEKDRKKE